jgi:hypothetical protein
MNPDSPISFDVQKYKYVIKQRGDVYTYIEATDHMAGGFGSSFFLCLTNGDTGEEWNFAADTLESFYRNPIKDVFA